MRNVHINLVVYAFFVFELEACVGRTDRQVKLVMWPGKQRHKKLAIFLLDYSRVFDHV